MVSFAAPIFDVSPLTAKPSQKGDVPTSATRLRRYLQSVPLHQLSSFEPVTDQFAAWGILFEGAIALFPSNTRFMQPQDSPVLMPTQQYRALTLALTHPPVQLILQLQGDHSLQPWVVDQQGHPLDRGAVDLRVAPCTEGSREQAPVTTLTLKASVACRLLITSTAPFIVGSVNLQADY